MMDPMKPLTPATRIKVLGVPLDLGAGHRGVDMGPSAIRVAGLLDGLRALGFSVEDLGNVFVPPPESRDPGDPKARFLKEILHACREIAGTLDVHLDDDVRPVILGGDHSLAIGSVAGTSMWWKRRGHDIGLIWVDAHTDMNTPDTTPTGNIHGMPMAHLLGMGRPELVDVGGKGPKVNPENVVMIGIRSVDTLERELVKQSGVTVFTMRDVDEMGIRRCMERAIQIAGHRTAGFHLSYDVDGVDALEAPGVGTPVRGGLTYREAHLIAEMAHDSGRLLAMDVTEVNPVEDTRNQTGRLAAELVFSAFGRRIL
jgi:arginase